VPRIVGIAVIGRLIVTKALKLSDSELSTPPRRGSGRDGTRRKTDGSRKTDAGSEQASAFLLRETGCPAVLDPRSSVELQNAEPNELDRLYRSLSEVTPETHPRTARLLASSTRKAAQKVIEEAGEVALEAVKHHARGVVRESADLLYHLVALWRRAGIDPEHVWTEMRMRADTLGIAEKLPKAGGNQRSSQRQTSSGEE
jgi:phosphoribosyl-ATP pyrophosphohydrolase